MNLQYPKTISSLGDLIDAVKEIRNQWNSDGLSNEELWFRGHADITYKLLPSIYRPDSVKAGYARNEGTLIQVFQLQSRRHVAPLGHSTTNFREWYVEARHHGLPTRLLDWTDNALVALYFAVECHWSRLSRQDWYKHRDNPGQAGAATTTPCVWMMDAGALNSLSQSFDGIYKLDTSETGVDDYFCETGTLTAKTRNHLPIAIYPPRLGTRITAQSGFFTLHGHLHDSLEEIAERHPTHLQLRRIDIEPRAVAKIIDELMLCGVTKASVYPGMDSVADYVKWAYHE